MFQRVMSAQPWLPLGEPDTNDIRLFCLPNAGASAHNFSYWQELSDSRVTIAPIQPPGRAERFRDEPHSNLDELVSSIIEHIGDQFYGRYALFGHSLGALVAFELARRLRAENMTPPERLFISGRMAPHIPYHRQVLHNLPTSELIPELRKIGGTPEEILKEPALIDMFLPSLRADFAINETYKHQADTPLDTPITVFGGDKDPRTTKAELLAWRTHTGSDFSLHMFSGGHFFVHDQAADLLDIMVKELTNGDVK